MSLLMSPILHANVSYILVATITSILKLKLRLCTRLATCRRCWGEPHQQRVDVSIQMINTHRRICECGSQQVHGAAIARMDCLHRVCMSDTVLRCDLNACKAAVHLWHCDDWVSDVPRSQQRVQTGTHDQLFNYHIAVCKVIGPNRPTKVRPDWAQSAFRWPTSAARPANHF